MCQRQKLDRTRRRRHACPAVLHAVLEILPRKPDLVVSGINYGENVGSGVTVSGTVGAALDAAVWAFRHWRFPWKPTLRVRRVVEVTL